MQRLNPPADLAERPPLLQGMAIMAVGGWVVFTVCILVADFVVPDHDWIADTISDLAAGEYEMITDMGIYAYSAALMACAVGAAHAHMGGKGWTWSIYALIVTGLVVFLVGARDEYGDGDDESVALHVYLVYTLYVTFAFMPWAMSDGVALVSRPIAFVMRGVTVAWTILAPFFFFLPTAIDGIYERMLGAITFVFVTCLALAFWKRAAALNALDRTEVEDGQPAAAAAAE
jgi:hypothetical protein